MRRVIKAEWTNKDSLDLQPTCNQLATDLINRQDAIEAIARDIPFITFTEDPKRTAQRIVGTVPSADRPTGEWERVLYKRQGHEEVIVDGHSWRCTNCGDARKRNDIDMKYCPNCGAKMSGDSDE